MHESTDAYTVMHASLSLSDIAAHSGSLLCNKTLAVYKRREVFHRKDFSM